ncbi:IclR family transcriptional regulator [Nitratireductor aquibiodomus]|nr:IclR family transcriptional regulator [Nitratireductor aquibiodomus]
MSLSDAEPGQREKRAGTIQSVSIAMRFLKILADAETPLPLGELAKRAGTGNSSAHRYLQSLVKEGLADQDALSGRYDLGPQALNIGIGALRRIDPVEAATQRVKQLAAEMTTACGIVIWTDRGPTVVRWFKNARFTISTVSLGDVLPLDNSACGLVFQAYLTPQEIAVARETQPDMVRGTPPPETRLEEVRREGGAELSEHLFSALTGKAAPVFDAQGELACVMSTVSLLENAANEKHREALFLAARDVSLGTPPA